MKIIYSARGEIYSSEIRLEDIEIEYQGPNDITTIKPLSDFLNHILQRLDASELNILLLKKRTAPEDNSL